MFALIRKRMRPSAHGKTAPEPFEQCQRGPRFPSVKHVAELVDLAVEQRVDRAVVPDRLPSNAACGLTVDANDQSLHAALLRREGVLLSRKAPNIFDKLILPADNALGLREGIRIECLQCGFVLQNVR